MTKPMGNLKNYFLNKWKGQIFSEIQEIVLLKDLVIPIVHQITTTHTHTHLGITKHFLEKFNISKETLTNTSKGRETLMGITVLQKNNYNAHIVTDGTIPLYSEVELD